MAEADPRSARPRRGQGLWLTAGEIVGVLALIVAGLNYWESHSEHIEDSRRLAAQTRAATAFVATGEVDQGGRVIVLRPLKASQAIQSQRYEFPGDIRPGSVEITAERPRIQLEWLGSGLKHALDAAHARSSGEARVPVGIETIYVEDGDTRSDVSLYLVGFSWKHEFLAGRQIRLTGIALSHRGLGSDSAKAVESAWSAAKRGFSTSRSAPPG
jgi:hypothetical protein